MIQKKFDAKIENLNQMISFIIESLEQKGLSKKFLGQLRLVCEETFINVINYAYPDDNPGCITIIYDLDKSGKNLEIKIVDQGIAFDPLQQPNPDLSLPLEDRKIGGLGIFMIRKIMDNVEYHRDNNSNVLILSKEIPN